MNRQRISTRLIVLGSLVTLLISCAFGRNNKITAGDISLEIISVSRVESLITSDGSTYKPKSDNDIILLVKAQLLSGNPETVLDWKVLVRDESGQVIKPSMKSSHSTYSDQVEESETEPATELQWVFVVAKSAKAFTLIFPDEQTIKLDHLLKDDVSE